MAKKKRKRPYTPPQTRVEGSAPAPEAPRATRVSAASAARRDRKEDARRQREAIVRRMRRAAIIRRVVIATVVLVAVGGLVLYFVVQAQRNRTLIDRAREVAETQNCSQPITRPDAGNNHQDQGPIEYAEQPPTSGPHRTAPLPAGDRVYTPDRPAEVTQAVHNLEHGYVVIWYRDGELSDPVVEELAALAGGEGEVLLSPYEQLPEGTDLALTAWNRVQQCPAESRTGQALSAEQARTLADAFIAQFRNQTAPENAAA